MVYFNCICSSVFLVWPFTARSNLVPYVSVWEKVKTMDFSETVVVYDIKVGRWSQLNKYMKFYEYQRSRSFFDLVRSHSDSIFPNFISSITAKSIEAKVHVELSWNGGIKCEFKWLRSHDQDGRHDHIWLHVMLIRKEQVNHLKIMNQFCP